MRFAGAVMELPGVGGTKISVCVLDGELGGDSRKVLAEVEECRSDTENDGSE